MDRIDFCVCVRVRVCARVHMHGCLDAHIAIFTDWAISVIQEEGGAAHLLPYSDV